MLQNYTSKIVKMINFTMSILFTHTHTVLLKLYLHFQDFLAVLRIEPRVSSKLGKHSITGLQIQFLLNSSSQETYKYIYSRFMYGE